MEQNIYPRSAWQLWEQTAEGKRVEDVMVEGVKASMVSSFQVKWTGFGNVSLF